MFSRSRDSSPRVDIGILCLGTFLNEDLVCVRTHMRDSSIHAFMHSCMYNIVFM